MGEGLPMMFFHRNDKRAFGPLADEFTLVFYYQGGSGRSEGGLPSPTDNGRRVYRLRHQTGLLPHPVG